MRRRVVIIFAKAPRMGSVKTRLARGIGQGAALRFYRRCLAGAVRAAQRLPVADIMIWTAPDNAVAGRYFPRRLPPQAQGRGDLGARMFRALAACPDADCLLIGGDIPDIAPDALQEALACLKTHDAVFGPSEDGGFWLVGLAAGFRPRGLFSGVAWSTRQALQQTLLTLPAHARVACCRTLNDVDDVRDYRRVTAS